MLTTIKDIAATVQSIFTVGAIIVGGIWTYFGFIQHRLDSPRLQITQRISHVRISDKQNLLVVDETLNNPGQVLLDLRKRGVRVVQIVPVPSGVTERIAARQELMDSDKNKKGDVWPIVGEREEGSDENDKLEIEPGETDQLHYEFVLPADVKTVNVVSYVYNPQEPDLAWRAENMYDFRSAEPGAAGSSERKKK